MQLKAIKRGKWYRTRQGAGECVSAGGTRPPSVQIHIVAPFPRGKVTMSPRDVLEEIDPVTCNPGGKADA
jgi:hypothetical protein